MASNFDFVMERMKERRDAASASNAKRIEQKELLDKAKQSKRDLKEQGNYPYEIDRRAKATEDNTAVEKMYRQAKNAVKGVTGKDVDEVLENVKAPTKDARAESIKNSMTRGGGGGGGVRGGGSGTLGGGAGATGADLLHMMNPQKLMKKGGAVKSASARADGIAIRGKTRA